MIDEVYLENLDGSWPDDLRAYAARLASLVVDPEDRLTRDLLREYALTKAVAMDARKAGKIAKALRQERACEALYKKLPGYAKW